MKNNYEADEVVIKKSELDPEMRHKRKKAHVERTQTVEFDTDPTTLPGL